MADVLDPKPIFELLALHFPRELHPHVLVVGSLAAAYHYRDQLRQRSVNTKDADIVIQPAGAVAECRTIAQRLLAAGWVRHPKCHPSPPGTPHGDLRAIRLHPPDSRIYFIELLAFPERSQRDLKLWIPCELEDGLYALPSFRFMTLTGVDRLQAAEGFQYAHPAMMALSNLLAHPRVGPELIGEPLGGRAVRRAAKDLGRVLALARLAGRSETERWAEMWELALRVTYGGEAPVLAARSGAGLRELLQDPGFLDDAYHSVTIGLLSGLGVTKENFAMIGAQLLQDAIDPLEMAFRS
jgi:hypothetical protein